MISLIIPATTSNQHYTDFAVQQIRELYPDENEVESITGFKAKGIAMLGSDEIVTSYQTHFHEVAHLLINFKLKTWNDGIIYY